MCVQSVNFSTFFHDTSNYYIRDPSGVTRSSSLVPKPAVPDRQMAPPAYPTCPAHSAHPAHSACLPDPFCPPGMFWPFCPAVLPACPACFACLPSLFCPPAWSVLPTCPARFSLSHSARLRLEVGRVGPGAGRVDGSGLVARGGWGQEGRAKISKFQGI